MGPATPHCLPRAPGCLRRTGPEDRRAGGRVDATGRLPGAFCGGCLAQRVVCLSIGDAGSDRYADHDSRPVSRSLIEKNRFGFRQVRYTYSGKRYAVLGSKAQQDPRLLSPYRLLFFM